MAASDDYQRTVLEFIRSHPEGIAETVLEDRLKGMSQEMRVQAINDLLMQGKIVLFQHATLGRFYREVQHDLSRLVALSAEERLVYNYIEAAGDKGIWIADLKFKSNIPPMSLQKLLKNLERKKLIKSVKPVTNKTRKVYMLAHLEPSREITGGAWYSDNELDQEMIAVCQKTALAFIMQNRFGTLEQVHSFIRQHKLLTVELRADEVQAVLDTLLYDGRVRARGGRRGGRAGAGGTDARPADRAVHGGGRCPAVSTRALVCAAVVVQRHPVRGLSGVSRLHRRRADQSSLVRVHAALARVLTGRR